MSNLWGNFGYLTQRISDYGREYYWDLDVDRNSTTNKRQLILRKRMQTPHIFSVEETEILKYRDPKDKKIIDKLLCKYHKGYLFKNEFYKKNVFNGNYNVNLRGTPISFLRFEKREVYSGTTLFVFMGIIGIMIAYIIHAILVERMIKNAYTKTDEEFKRQKGFPRKFYILLYYLLLGIIFMCVLLLSGFLMEIVRNRLLSSIIFPSSTPKMFHHSTQGTQKYESTRDLKMFENQDGRGGRFLVYVFSIFSCILFFTFLYLLWHMVKDDHIQKTFFSCFGVLSALLCISLVAFYVS